MPKQVWIIAGVLTALLVVLFLGLANWQKSQQLAQAQVALDEARRSASQHDAGLADLKAKLEESQARIAELEKEKEFAARMHKSLEDEMRTALESKDVTISQLQGRLTVNILDRILFDSGEADLRPEGESVLRKVAAILTAHPQIKVHVIGHTDNVPIKATARSRFASNWELSTARATAAVRFLTEHAGVDPRRIGAVGYGEFRPVAENSTPEGRAKNRRIAITMLSEELAGADVPPAPKPEPAAPPPIEGNSPQTVR